MGISFTALRDGRFKRNRISAVFLATQTRENITPTALLPYLLERSQAAYPSPVELDRRLAELYGATLTVDASRYCGCRALTVSAEGIDDRFALEGEKLLSEYAGLVAGTVFEPDIRGDAFDSLALEVEKEKLSDAILNEINDKREYALMRAMREFYGERPEGLPKSGFSQDIEAITPHSLARSHCDFFSDASAYVLFAGSGDPEEVRAAFSNSDIGHETAITAAPPVFSAERRVEERLGRLEQAKLVSVFSAGRKLTTAETDRLRVAMAIFSGMPTSRLFTNVREKQALCYYCSARISYNDAILVADSGVDEKNADRTGDAIAGELSALQSGGVTQEELTAAKQLLKNSYKSLSDTPSGLIGWTLGGLLRGDTRSAAETVESIERVSADDVSQALSIFKPALRYTLTGGKK